MAALPGPATPVPDAQTHALRRAAADLELAATSASRYGRDPSIKVQHEDTEAGLASASAAAANAGAAR